MALRNIVARTGLALACALSLGLGLACGGGGGSKTTAPSVKAAAPTITTALESTKSVVAGTSVTLSVTATSPDGGTLSYAWSKGTTALSETSRTLTLANPATTDSGTYTVVVTNTLNSTTATASNSCALTVTAAPATAGKPTITTPLESTKSVVAGTSVTLSVTATSPDGGTLSYAWSKGTTALSETSRALTLATPATTDSGTYTVVVTNTLNGTTATESSSCVLTVTATPANTPKITAQPVNQSVTVPDGAKFSVTATGDNLTYQWYTVVNDVLTKIDGATNSIYTTSDTDLQTVPASYKVIVTSNGDSATSVTSDAATYALKAPSPTYAGDPVATGSRTIRAALPAYTANAYAPDGVFRFGYEEAMKNPAWTAYADFKVNSPYANSNRTFSADDRLEVPLVQDADYGSHSNTFFKTDGSGFDRGHVVTMSDISYRYGDQAGTDSCRMSNVIPQVSYFNQRIWQNLESAVGGETINNVFNNGLSATFRRVWIYTGPVYTGTVNYWLPDSNSYTTSPASGVKAIAIPTACYKIMVAEPASGQTRPRVMAWLSSNRSYATSENTDLWKYVTSLKRIEELTGLNFLPSLTDDDGTLAAWKAQVEVRGWGTDFEKATGPNVHMIQPSWDILPITGSNALSGFTVNVNAPVTFEAVVTPNVTGGSVDTTNGCTWTFGDGGTANGLNPSYTYTTVGTYTATFSATDGTTTNSISRKITVVDASLPSISPIADVSTNNTTAKTVTFTVADGTPAAAPLTVTATSSNTSVLLDNLTVSNSNGTCTLVLTPVAGSTGTSTITVTVTNANGKIATRTFTFTVTATTSGGLTETFETGTVSTSYTTGDVTLSTGKWGLVNGLIGSAANNDIVMDTKSVRLKNKVVSSLTMGFDVATAVSKVTLSHATYGTSDGFSIWGLYYSTDGGTNWTQTGSNITTSSHTMTTTSFDINLSGPIRFKVVTDATSTRQLNVDNFTIE